MTGIAFCVSGGGLAVRACIEASRTGVIAFTPSVVICDRPSGVLDFAEQRGVPAELVDYAAQSTRAAFDRAIEESLATHRSDWLVLNFNRLLAPTTITRMGGRVVNLHLSLLPRFPGFGAVKAALAAGLDETGVSFHLVDDSIDGGPLIAQASVPIVSGDTPDVLTRRLYERAVPLQLQLCRLMSRAGPVEPGRLVDRAVPGAEPFALAVDPDIAAFADQFLDQTLGERRVRLP